MDNIATLPPIHPGDHVEVISLSGILPRIATTEVMPGSRFPVIWVCREEEWFLALREEREPDAVPWPAEDVRQLRG